MPPLALPEALRVGELGDAEVADLAGPVAVHENVVGFDVEMQDLVLMCEFDGIADGEDDCRGDVEIEGRGGVSSMICAREGPSMASMMRKASLSTVSKS